MLDQLKMGYSVDLGYGAWRHRCPIGRVFPGELSKGTIVMHHPGIMQAQAFINDEILKALLINNKEFIAENLGLVITEVGAEVVAEPEPEPETETTEDLTAYTKAELSALAQTLGILIPKKATKADMIKLIKEV